MASLHQPKHLDALWEMPGKRQAATESKQGIVSFHSNSTVRAVSKSFPVRSPIMRCVSQGASLKQSELVSEIDKSPDRRAVLANTGTHPIYETSSDWKITCNCQIELRTNKPSYEASAAPYVVYLKSVSRDAVYQRLIRALLFFFLIKTMSST